LAQQIKMTQDLQVLEQLFGAEKERLTLQAHAGVERIHTLQDSNRQLVTKVNVLTQDN